MKLLRENINYANCIFEQPWLLDAVLDSNWDEVRVENNGEVIARLPFLKTKRFGFKIVSMPPLTKTVGPWIKPSYAKNSKRLEREKNYF